MTNWKQHDGGPQPVADDVWVYVVDPIDGNYQSASDEVDWPNAERYRILNQHLIDAARLEGIRLGLEAAAKALQAHDTRPGAWSIIVQAIRAVDPETIAKEADQ